MKPKEFLKALKAFLSGFATAGTDALEAELKEMENVFALLLVGSMVGLPAPPQYIGIKVLPYIERELIIMLRRAERSGEDTLADWFSILDMG